MAKTESYPLLIREQSVVVKIYRQKAATTASGYSFAVTWVGPDGREKRTYADLKDAKEEAQRIASQLASGIAQSQLISRSDALELAEARRLVEAHGVPLLSAVAEWAKAKEVAGPAVLEACEAWARRRTATVERITVADAVKQLIAEKNAANKEGTRTYAAKLKPMESYFQGRYIDSITAKEWSSYLNRYDDAVTRNDFRKRAVTLCRWAQRHNHLAEGVQPEIERTERAKEHAKPIGILTPKVYHQLLGFIRSNHPELLAALVIAGLCGVRSEEIHGKRRNPKHRQVWEDIDLTRKFLAVSNAKENTPSRRIVHLSAAAIAWLEVCPGEHRGPICDPNAIDKIRRHASRGGYVLPENCFRHSWITYRIALTGDKPSTSTEAGNSVLEIDRRYRVPRPKYEGEKWFATRP